MRTLVLDLEVFHDYFLAGFKDVESRKYANFEMFDGKPLDRKTVLSLVKSHRIVTFNGNTYDIPMLSMALCGRSCQQLKDASDRLIQERMMPWEFVEYFEVPILSINHIDIKEPVPGVMVSLKLYGARLHSKRLQDMPVEHTASITPDMRAEVRRYNENDLDTTIDLWELATSPKDNIIATREQLTEEFGQDLRSKSDAQCAEAMLKISVERKTEQCVYKQVVPVGTVYKFKPATFLTFKTPELRSMFNDVLAAEFVVNEHGKVELPEALQRAIPIGQSKYNMGIGGLHSMEQSVAHIATKDVLIRDRDVVSYYPSLILQCGLFPKSMGAVFQTVYADFLRRRVEAKRTGNKSVAQTLKIVLNGTFGKLGSKYSVLYSPDLMIQVTVTGQLAMLMLIERMELAGIPVVSANTDGIVMACPAPLEATMLAIVARWEKATGLETEETQYRALFSRDINNYLALKVGGGYKTKGVLVPGNAGKNPDYDIVAQAVCTFLDTGKPVAQSILECLDIRKFLRVRTANGGCKWGDQYLGRVARWYRSTESNTYIDYVKNGNKVGGSDNSRPLMELPDEFPADVDYDFYLNEASDLLRELGACK